MRKLLALALAVPAMATAAIYKCNQGGKVVYQQSPCANGVEMRVQSTVKESKARASSARTEQMKRWLKENDRKQRIRKLKRDIRYKGYEIEQLHTDMDAELAALRRKKARASNNLAGATWEQAISTEMDAVTRKYQVKIDAAQKDLEKMNAQLRSWENEKK